MQHTIVMLVVKQNRHIIEQKVGLKTKVSSIY